MKRRFGLPCGANGGGAILNQCARSSSPLFLAPLPLPLPVLPPTSCTEWVSLGGGPARSLIYRTWPLETRNEAITRAVIVVHGAGRDADNYFRNALAAAFLAGALDDTVVIAPRIASAASTCHDVSCAKRDQLELQHMEVGRTRDQQSGSHFVRLSGRSSPQGGAQRDLPESPADRGYRSFGRRPGAQSV